MLKVISVLILVFLAGCRTADFPSPHVGQGQAKPAKVGGCGFEAARVAISPLTQAVKISGGYRIDLYPEIEDNYNCRIKAPGVFRVELFEKRKLSSDPRGERIYYWEDIDLTDPEVNNNLWQDTLRSYLLNLAIPDSYINASEYILEVSFNSQDSRISSWVGLSFDSAN